MPEAPPSHIRSHNPLSTDAPSTVDNAQPAPPGAPQRRLVGIDVARGVAVIGMFIAHFNPFLMDPDDWLQSLVSGRSAALFAVLAGVSVALLSGGRNPRAGTALRVTRVQLGVRAIVLFVLGLALSALGTPVKEILSVYAVLFLLAIPILRVRPVVLASAAALVAVVGPVTSWGLRRGLVTDGRPGVTPSFGDFTSLPEFGRAAQGLLLTGPYPVITWSAFLLAGLAVGRLDLRSTVVRLRLLVGGAVLAIAAHTTSWLLMNPLGGFERVVRNLPEVHDLGQARALARSTIGVVPTNDPAFLLTTAPHTGAPLEILATSGLAMAVIGGALLFADRLSTVLVPLRSVGALALTSYVGHVVVIFLVGYEGMVAALTHNLYGPLIALTVGTMLFATLWRRCAKRGPLEWVLHSVAGRVGELVVRS